MIVRLKKARALKNPVLLGVPFDAGLSLGLTRTQVDEQRADEYAFVLWRPGTRGFRAAGCPHAAP
jgi:prolyl oligopeptidase